jgi:hypothetical protein
MKHCVSDSKRSIQPQQQLLGVGGFTATPPRQLTESTGAVIAGLFRKSTVIHQTSYS